MYKPLKTEGAEVFCTHYLLSGLVSVLRLVLAFQGVDAVSSPKQPQVRPEKIRGRAFKSCSFKI